MEYLWHGSKEEILVPDPTEKTPDYQIYNIAHQEQSASYMSISPRRFLITHAASIAEIKSHLGWHPNPSKHHQPINPNAHSSR